MRSAISLVRAQGPPRAPSLGGYHAAMKPITTRVLAAVAAAMPLCAQDDPLFAPFRLDFAFGGGRLEHRTDQSNLDGDTDAGFFRFAFEGIGDEGFGGGVRLEGITSDDDLFDDAGFTATEASASSLFGHFTFRVAEDYFVMPVRIGLQLHGYVLEETATGDQTTSGSFGPQFEVAPELLLSRDDHVCWSVYSQLGLGFAATSIDVDTVGNDFESGSFFYGFELGTRLYAGHVVFGLGLLVRGQATDESDDQGGTVVLGMENDFTGLLFSIGAVF